MNETIEKFGFPQTLVHELEHWVILLRPAQPTLGSLVLAEKSQATAFGDLPMAAHSELSVATRLIEDALQHFVHFTKINYLMLMMVDPNVHFHVIPRYEGSRSFEGVAYADAGWPKLPELSEAVALDEQQIQALVGSLKPLFATGS